LPAIEELVDAATGGDRTALARLLSIAERGGDAQLEIEHRIAPHIGNGFVIGITGAPGAGKSTLINALLSEATEARGRAAVLAVDPSSPFSHGALLGDRVRMQGTRHGAEVFIRSMASRGEVGGLARAAATGVRLFDACGWPVIIIETLGIGQVELDIMNLADMVAVVLTPGWGDTIQANKAGLTEAGDIFVINKADKPGAADTRTDLLESLALLHREAAPPVIDTVATQHKGVDDLWQALENERERLISAGELDTRREQRRRRMIRALLSRYLADRIRQVMNSDAAEALIDHADPGEFDLQASAEKLLAMVKD
jgi:LAO/AO transport system kinase